MRSQTMVQQPPPPPPPPPPFFFAANAMPISWFQSSGLVKFHVATQSCFSSESPHGVSAPILPKSPMSFSEGQLSLLTFGVIGAATRSP